MDVPYLGALFSRKRNTINEVELLDSGPARTGRRPGSRPGAALRPGHELDEPRRLRPVSGSGYMEVPVKQSRHDGSHGRSGHVAPEQVVPPNPSAPTRSDAQRPSAAARSSRAVVVERSSARRPTSGRRQLAPSGVGPTSRRRRPVPSPTILPIPKRAKRGPRQIPILRRRASSDPSVMT